MFQVWNWILSTTMTEGISRRKTLAWKKTVEDNGKNDCLKVVFEFGITSKIIADKCRASSSLNSGVKIKTARYPVPPLSVVLCSENVINISSCTQRLFKISETILINGQRPVARWRAVNCFAPLMTFDTMQKGCWTTASNQRQLLRCQICLCMLWQREESHSPTSRRGPHSFLNA